MSDIVIVDFDDISDLSKDLTDELERAFGGRLSSTSKSDTSSPLGIIAIRNIPNFVEAKNVFLPMAHDLAHLKPEYYKSLEDPTSFYNAGWSHGKEKLGDEPDFAKASYYFNPLTDTPGTQDEREKYPASYPCNRWPNEEELPQLKDFKQSAKNLGKIMHQTVALVAKHIDAMAEKRVVGYRKGLLFDAMQHTEKAKGRLLYYYPIENDETATADKEDNWIGWHNDSGFLTSLAGDLFLDDKTGQPLPPDQIDPEAGLYVTNRSGEAIHVKIPDDCMAVQIGECVQILTGGVVTATPHCVRGPRAGFGSSDVKVARISCPCFIDSKPSFPLTLPEGCTSEKTCQAGIGRDKVPLLEERWVENGMAFGSFLQKSFEKYYDWSER